jgi:hypothetical protein
MSFMGTMKDKTSLGNKGNVLHEYGDLLSFARVCPGFGHTSGDFAFLCPKIT